MTRPRQPRTAGEKYVQVSTMTCTPARASISAQPCFAICAYTCRLVDA